MMKEGRKMEEGRKKDEGRKVKDGRRRKESEVKVKGKGRMVKELCRILGIAWCYFTEGQY